ncbi:MAG: NDP-sugar synthase [Candidatus Thermoplasmatota archaeon]|nr:NDP-sugar synthase [Candidatus Thermoplasmatota archaeon]
MKAVVLAGGYGTRLRPLTETVPKPLLPVAGVPCIDYVLRSLASADFREIIVATSYMSDRVIKRIGDGLDYGASILYSFEAVPAGTAGAVKTLEDFVDGTFVVASGDVLADVNLQKLFNGHTRSGALATMALTRAEDTRQFGVVEVDAEGRLVRFQEKPAPEEAFSDLINAGIYVLEPEVLAFVPERKTFDFSKDLFPLLLEEGEALYGMELEGLWMDIGRPEDLWRASLEVIRRTGTEVALEGVKSEGPVLISPEVRINEGVEIEGPSYVGRGATLSKGVRVRRSCVYDGVFLDRDVDLEDSIVMEGGHIGWRSRVRGSVLSTACIVDEDVEILDSVLGDAMHVRAHSRLEGASLAPPAE